MEYKYKNIAICIAFLIGCFLIVKEDYKKQITKKEIQSNYSETIGHISSLKFTPRGRRNPEKYEARIEYEVNGESYFLMISLKDDFKYRFNTDIKAEEGDNWMIAFSSKNPEMAKVVGDYPKLNKFYEENPDKILGNKKIEFIELYNHGVDTIGIVTHIDCKKDSSKAIIEYPSTNGKKYKIELEVAYYNDNKAIYKAQGLPTVRIGDSLKIRFSSRVPQVYRLLESAPNIALPRY